MADRSARTADKTRPPVEVLIALASLLPLVPFLWPLWIVEERPVEVMVWVLVGASALANVAVLAYHHLVPAHPKFLILGFRRAVLRVHVWSGTLEFTAGIVALATFPNPSAALIMALAALIGHVPSALIQTAIVFGSRAIMRPAYVACIALHGFSAVMLLRFPESQFWLVSTFLVFNIYVWCRVYYFLFDKFGFFTDSKYTVAIVLAGLTTAPAVIGPAALLALAGCCGLHLGLHALLLPFRPGELADFIRERPRDSTHSRSLAEPWTRTTPLDDRVAARRHFARLDQNSDGELDLRELAPTLGRSGSAIEVVRLLSDGEIDPRLDFDTFLARLWPIDAVREQAALAERSEQARSDRDKAAFVFAQFDRDGDGTIAVAELRLVLDEWSLPPTETAKWLRAIDVDLDGRIDFDEFLVKLRPVWRFVHHDIVETSHGPRPDMIVRALAAHRAEAATREVEAVVRRELVAKVDFLRTANAEFLDELSASLTRRSARSEECLCEQGAVGDSFWIIREGRVRVERDGMRVAELGPGHWFGEGALLDGGPRAARVVASGDAELFEISAASFRYLLERHADMAARVTEVARARRGA
jgi:Ca2+-binding EF-hand superfamily protein